VIQSLLKRNVLKRNVLRGNGDPPAE
jgi:hypothetical protein